MKYFQDLLKHYDAIIVLNLETTGLTKDDFVYKISALRLENDSNSHKGFFISDGVNTFIKSETGMRLPKMIVKNTGVTDGLLNAKGIDLEKIVYKFKKISQGKCLIVTCNALPTLAFFQRIMGKDFSNNFDYLDIYTVVRDRKDYPYKLKDLTQYYEIDNSERNSLMEVNAFNLIKILESIEKEESNLKYYINIVGLNKGVVIDFEKIDKILYGYQSGTRERKFCFDIFPYKLAEKKQFSTFNKEYYELLNKYNKPQEL